MRCVLVLGGPSTLWAGNPPQITTDDYIIACDGGYATAVTLGWKPHMAVGDFDTYRGGFAPGIEVVTAPSMKDETDAMLGIRMAISRGFRDFLIVGALGGRLDHAVANLQILSYLNAHEATGEILSADNRVWLVRNGSLTVPRIPGWYLSVFAWGGACAGVSLEGLLYPLENAVLTPEEPLGVSNEFVEAQARITVKAGSLLVIASRA